MEAKRKRIPSQYFLGRDGLIRTHQAHVHRQALTSLVLAQLKKFDSDMCIGQGLAEYALDLHPLQRGLVDLAHRRQRHVVGKKDRLWHGGALADVLAHMVASPGPSLSPAVRLYVVAHDVDGLAPGAYRYEPDQHALAPQATPTGAGEAGRAATRAAALDQDVAADAAVVFVLSMDRAAFAADPLGPARGYRHAFLEAGMVGERVYLAAGALGLGACAVGAFHDDEAAALVGADPAREWVVHFAALGMKA